MGRAGLTGSAAAAPLLFNIVESLPAARFFRKPEKDLQPATICAQSGYQAGPHCEDKRVRNYGRSKAQTRLCPFHQLIHLDSSGRYRVNSDCYPVALMRHSAWFVASPAQEYYYKQIEPRYRTLPAILPGCESDRKHRQLEIVYPSDKFQVYIPVHENGKKGRCVLKATHRKRDAQLFWYVDGKFLGTTTTYHQISLLASAGEHVLEISDEAGETAIRRFEVLEKS
jgi:penicillin-binding protein 1C